MKKPSTAEKSFPHVPPRKKERAMARSFLRGGTWGKLFSAVDGFFILSPTGAFLPAGPFS